MSERTPQIQIIKDGSLSVDNLVDLENQGSSVMRSQHVGNASLYNMVLANAGMRMLSVDHNITGVDTLYNPELIRTAEGDAVIAELGKLSCRATVGKVPKEVAGLVNGSRFVDQVHVDSYRQAFPQADIFTNTEYLRANEAVAGELVQLAAREFPDFFARIVRPDGTPIKAARAASMIPARGVMQLNDDPRAEETAVLIPNVLDIAINFIIEALASGQAVQYHMTGRDMIRYIDGLIPDLNRFYARVKQTCSFANRLPDELVVRMVPTIEAKFATTTARRAKLDRLLGAVARADAERAAIQAERKAFFEGQPSVNVRSFVDAAKARELAIDQSLVAAMAEMPELFAGPGELGALTHYDVLREGGLYVPPINTGSSMDDLAQLTTRLRVIRKKFGLGQGAS